MKILLGVLKPYGLDFERLPKSEDEHSARAWVALLIAMNEGSR